MGWVGSWLRIRNPWFMDYGVISEGIRLHNDHNVFFVILSPFFHQKKNGLGSRSRTNLEQAACGNSSTRMGFLYAVVWTFGVYSYHMESRLPNSHILVCHGHLLGQLLRVAPSTFTRVYFFHFNQLLRSNARSKLKKLKRANAVMLQTLRQSSRSSL